MKYAKTILSLVLAIVFLWSCAALSISAIELDDSNVSLEPITPIYPSGEICVIYKETDSLDFSNNDSISQLIGKQIKASKTLYSSKSTFDVTDNSDNTRISETISRPVGVVTIELNDSSKDEIKETISTLKSNSDVLAVFENSYFEINSVVLPDIDLELPLGWNTDLIGVDQAWEKGFKNANNITIAHLGSGISSDQDLQNNVNWNLGCNVNEGYNDVSDSNGWGTSGAKIIGADYNDNYGIDGICQTANIIPIRITTIGSSTNFATIAAGVAYAVACDADIIYYPFDLANSVYIEINNEIHYAFEDFDGLFITDAGENADESLDLEEDSYQYGKLINRDDWIIVGASDENDELFTTSNYSDQYVDLFAPGARIWLKNDYYTTGAKTATAHVVAACALLMQYATHKTPVQIKELIMNSVTEVDALENLCVSGGRLSLSGAINILYNEARPAYSKGDLNGNGTIDTTDYTLCKRAVLGTYELNAVQNAAADINGNGTVDANDYALIQRFCLRSFYFAPY